IDQLSGTPCHAGAGTLAIAYAADGTATISCASGGGGGSATLRINEFMTGTTGSAADEFVEIVNVGTTAADLSGYKLVSRSGPGTNEDHLEAHPAGGETYVSRGTIPAGTTLAAGGFYLFGGSGYAGSPPPDQSFSTGLAST